MNYEITKAITVASSTIWYERMLLAAKSVVPCIGTPYSLVKATLGS